MKLAGRKEKAITCWKPHLCRKSHAWQLTSGLGPRSTGTLGRPHHVASNFPWESVRAGGAHLSCLVTTVTRLCLCTGGSCSSREPRLQRPSRWLGPHCSPHGPPAHQSQQEEVQRGPWRRRPGLWRGPCFKMSRSFAPHL